MKWLHSISRYLEYAETLACSSYLFHIPEHIQIEFTTACPLNCSMCARTAQNIQTGYMNKKTFFSVKRILPFAKKVTVAGYGEPFLHPYFFKYLRICRTLCPDISIITSGVTSEKNTAKTLKKTGVSSCTVSFDALDTDLFHKIRGISNEGPASFIDSLCREGIPTDLNIVFMKKNAADIKHIIARFPGVKNIWLFHPKIYSPHLLDESFLSEDSAQEFNNFKNSISEISRNTGITIHFPPDKNEQILCRQPFETLFIKYSGDVLSCCSAAFQTEKYNIYSGNLLHTSLFKILNSPDAIKFRKAFYGKSSYPRQCKNCAYRKTTLCSYTRIKT